MSDGLSVTSGNRNLDLSAAGDKPKRSSEHYVAQRFIVSVCTRW